MKLRQFLFSSVVMFLILLWAHASVGDTPLFGVQDDEMTYDSSLRSEAPGVGAKWVRQYLFWSDIEPNAPANGTPTCDWSKYDSLFLDYQNLGLTVIAVIGGLPSWAASQPYGPFNAGGMGHFKRFVRDLVERYDGDGVGDAPGAPVVSFFEFFNEPDLISTTYAGLGWGYWSASGGGIGAAYAQMLSEVYPVVKLANPNAMVLLGGLALENTPYFNFNFLDDVLSTGGGNYFDVMNFHYYVPFASVWQPYGKDILGKTAFVKSKLMTYGLSKPVFVTEAGTWSALDCMGTITPTNPGGLSNWLSSEEIQAQYATKLYARALSDADIEAVVWFVLRDKSFWDPCNGTRGLLKEDGSNKPAYDAYKTASDLLQGVTYRGQLQQPSIDEGYMFFSGRGRYIYALWNDSEYRVITLPIRANQVTMVGRSGNQQPINPFSENSYHVGVSPDPVYLILDVPPEIDSETISTPLAPTGPAIGTTSIYYSYNINGATSSLGDPVEYQFDWKGDGSDLSDWGSATRWKIWTTPGTYFVRARARCTWSPFIVSFWSPALTVRVLPPPPAVDNLPFGSFDISLPDATISSVVQVGGWALDDVGVTKVELRSDIPFWPYIGDLYYTCGTRPDVEAAYPSYPNNDCAGFGYMWMTNSMSETIDPQTGQRLEGTTHRFHLRIYDTAGHSVDIGHRNITLRNDSSVTPFGAMDVPLAGEILSGPVNISGWALAKGGWRVNQALVRLDGVVIGQANYGLHWPDLAQVFPVSVYPYSENAAYAYGLDTTLYSNGQHALDIVVADEVGNLAGIGSRYIYIEN